MQLSTMDIVKIAAMQVESWNADQVNEQLDETGIMESELILLHAFILSASPEKISETDIKQLVEGEKNATE